MKPETGGKYPNFTIPHRSYRKHHNTQQLRPNYPTCMFRRILFTFLSLIGLISGLQAQRTHSFSLGIGTLYYYGDLTDKFNNSLIRPAVQLGYNRYMLPNLSFRVALQYGEIGAADNMALDNGRRMRNLHFKSHIVETSGVLMYEFFRDKNFGNEWIGKPHVTPYVFRATTANGMNFSLWVQKANTFPTAAIPGLTPSFSGVHLLALASICA